MTCAEPAREDAGAALDDAARASEAGTARGARRATRVVACVAVVVALFPVASCRLLGGVVECADDRDCVGFGSCESGVCHEGGEGEGARGEGEGAGEGEGEGQPGEGEGEGGPPPDALFEDVGTITIAQPAMCAGQTAHTDVTLTAVVDVDVAFSSARDVVSVSPATLTLTAGDSAPIHIDWEVGAPPGVQGNIDIHDNVAGGDYSIRYDFTVSSTSSTELNVPAAATRDILYVIDDSASMSDQTNLGSSMSAHFDALFASPRPDARFAVTDIDDANSNSVGPFGDPRLCNGPFVDIGDTNARPDLDCTLNTLWGSFAGSGTEAPLGAMVGYFTAPNDPDSTGAFLRAAATLEIVYVGDSPDQTPGLTAQQAIDALDGLVVSGKTKSVHVHVVADAGPNEDCASTTPDAKMSDVRAAFDGEESSICDPTTRDATLARIAAHIRQPLDTVFVPSCAAGNAILCVVDGDHCQPIAGAVTDASQCTLPISPDADVAGHPILVAKGAACAL